MIYTVLTHIRCTYSVSLPLEVHLPTGDCFRCTFMADKIKTTTYGKAKVFLWILVFLFFVVLVSVYTTSNKLTYISSIPATIKSNLQDMFNGVVQRNTSLIVTLNGTLTVITIPTTVVVTRHVVSKIVLKATTNLQTPRPDACEACFSHNFKYVIDNDVMCKLYNHSQDIDLIIFIFTTHQRQHERNAIRKTWLNYTNKNTANIRYSFLLGEVPDENIRNLVEVENKIHNDIIKEDFVDTYHNLTYKTMMAFKYSITKCSHAKYVLKTDDDMWVNIPGLLKVIQREKTTLQTAVGGACHPVAGPIRNTASKWYASFQSYPHDSYPGFCSGTGYVTSINVARKVFEISKNVPFFHLEDVFVAICIRKLGYKLYPIPGFNAFRPPFDPCLYKGDALITSHEVPAEMLINFWNTPCKSQ